MVETKAPYLGRLIGFLEGLEPRSSPVLADVMAASVVIGGPLARRPRLRIHWIGPETSPRGVVVVVRRAFDLWAAHVVLLDEDAASEAAAVVDRSPAVALGGAARDLRNVLPRLTRLRSANNLPFVVSEHPHDVLEASLEGTRVATPADLLPLVDLYRNYEYGYERTVGQLRTVLARYLAEQLVVVAEDDRRLVGAFVVVGRTRRYAITDLLTVLPDHRGQDLTWRLGARGQALFNAMGLSVMGFLAPSNPVFVDRFVADETWMTARLDPLRRFRGHNRVRDLLAARDPRTHRTPDQYRDPDDPTRTTVAPTVTDGAGRIVR